MPASGPALHAGYVVTDSPWAFAARAALESAESAIPFRRGAHDVAARTLTDLLICLSGSSFERHRLDCLELLALVEACRGRLARSQELADTAERLAVVTAVPAKQRHATGHLARAWVATERQELSYALHWLDRAARLDELRDDPLLASLAFLLRARLMRDRGNPAAARRLLTSHDTTYPWVAAELADELAQLGTPATTSVDGATLASRVVPFQTTAAVDTLLDERDLRVQTESSQVNRLLQQAERQRSRRCLDAGRDLTLQALELGEPELLRRPFRHAGALVRALIRSDAEIAARARWLSPADVPGTTGVLPARMTSRLPDELTEREREVLRHLAALLSTQEIAATMFISVNTVRTHVRHILEKLTATRRNEAVRRARELGLV